MEVLQVCVCWLVHILHRARYCRMKTRKSSVSYLHNILSAKRELHVVSLLLLLLPLLLLLLLLLRYFFFLIYGKWWNWISLEFIVFRYATLPTILHPHLFWVRATLHAKELQWFCIYYIVAILSVSSWLSKTNWLKSVKVRYRIHFRAPAQKFPNKYFTKR